MGNHLPIMAHLTFLGLLLMASGLIVSVETVDEKREVAEGAFFGLNCQVDREQLTDVRMHGLRWFKLENGILRKAAVGSNKKIWKDETDRELKKTLEIYNAQQSDAGVYICRIFNNNNEQLFKLSVSLAVQPAVISDPITSSFLEGEAITLTCRIHSDMEHIKRVNHWEWYKEENGGLTKVEESRFFLCNPEEKHTKLIIQSARETDTAVYVCVANTTQGSFKDEMDLIVNRVLAKPNPPRIVEGETIPLFCSMSSYAKGIGSAAWYWFKMANGVRATLGNSTRTSVKTWKGLTELSIKNVRLSDAGDYYCMADTGMYQFVERVSLDVQRNIFEKSLSPPTVTEGDYIPLQCSIEPMAIGIASVKTLDWYKIENSLKQKVENTSTTYIETSRTEKHYETILHIENVRQSNAGHYQCVATTENDTYTKRVSLQVEPDVFRDSSKLVRVTEGAPTSLMCSLDPRLVDDAEMIKWAWFLASKGSKTRILDSERTYIDGDGTQYQSVLSFNNARPSDEGIYLCLAEIGRRRHQRNITLEVNTVLATPPTHPTIYEGQSLPLSCTINGRAKDTRAKHWQWYKLVKHGRKEATATNATEFGTDLLIKNARRSDGGDYVCVVTTRRGQFERQIRVNVAPGKHSHQIFVR